MELVLERSISERSLQIAKLREEYDAAFRELVRETKRCQEQAAAAAHAHTASAGSCKRIQAAADAVRQRRDTIAAFLLNKQGQGSEDLSEMWRRPERAPR